MPPPASRAHGRARRPGASAPERQQGAAKAAARTPPADAEDKWIAMFQKTKMCKFHAVGMCNRGSSCQFAHSAEEMNPLPDLTRTKICKALIHNGVCNDPNCKYAHSKSEIRAGQCLPCPPGLKAAPRPDESPKAERSPAQPPIDAADLWSLMALGGWLPPEWAATEWGELPWQSQEWLKEWQAGVLSSSDDGASPFAPGMLDAAASLLGSSDDGASPFAPGLLDAEASLLGSSDDGSSPFAPGLLDAEASPGAAFEALSAQDWLASSGKASPAAAFEALSAQDWLQRGLLDQVSGLNTFYEQDTMYHGMGDSEFLSPEDFLGAWNERAQVQNEMYHSIFEKVRKERRGSGDASPLAALP